MQRTRIRMVRVCAGAAIGVSLSNGAGYGSTD